MTSTGWEYELEILRATGVVLEDGLTASELSAAENRCGSPFPPDLRAFLECALPSGPRFPNWRGIADDDLQRWLSGPFEGIAFDIENNSFWWSGWGERPKDTQQALALARAAIEAAPRLIPVFGHRFIPSEPLEIGNPVFSVVQTDIIHYGRDFRSYLAHEFGDGQYGEASSPGPRRIRFWSDLVDANNQRAG